MRHKLWFGNNFIKIRYSFDQCGIKTNITDLYHNQLRHFINSWVLADEIVDNPIDYENDFGFNVDSDDDVEDD